MSTSRDRYPMAMRGWRLDLINGEATGGILRVGRDDDGGVLNKGDLR
jgi:hypothetical protein